MKSSDKRYILFAGVNGAGKSTLYTSLPYLSDLPRINIDEIARKYGTWTDNRVMFNAGKEAVNLLKMYFFSGVSFNQETTLCGKSILKNISAARCNGYRIEVHYVGVESVDICKSRIAMRVSKGGHGIPDEDVERRYTESMKNMKDILPQCDTVTFYDNTESFNVVAMWSEDRMELLSDNLPAWFSYIWER